MRELYELRLRTNIIAKRLKAKLFKFWKKIEESEVEL